MARLVHGIRNDPFTSQTPNLRIIDRHDPVSLLVQTMTEMEFITWRGCGTEAHLDFAQTAGLRYANQQRDRLSDTPRIAIGIRNKGAIPFTCHRLKTPAA